MVLQRCMFQITKQYVVGRCSVMKSSVILPSSQFRCQYSSSSPRKYTDRHEWIVVHNNIGTVGISQYAQESLGDVVFAQLPDPGSEFKTGDECGALESVKAASEIYSPLTGTITEKNKEVEDKPGLINSSCYEKGWLFKIKVGKMEEFDKLMDEGKYQEFLKSDVEKDH